MYEILAMKVSLVLRRSVVPAASLVLTLERCGRPTESLGARLLSEVLHMRRQLTVSVFVFVFAPSNFLSLEYSTDLIRCICSHFFKGNIQDLCT